ncbi:nucleoporin SEH1-like isoform X2 [Xenia sp. Carnegie-2017]|uniref:nucleoporin SEH1-like isoform X2 n=1 Tax=Xenia sp. Carnegie-2017 TaxID=2897299 RepID=UPI001F04F6BC|nr:nucleoporin SEH1-like isoform X2 [Xenia sp. Carnegie-2017]
MFASKEITSDHKDLIHDVAFDFHGRRMATCSSDQTVKTHYGSVWRVTWAHPEFGQVLATCSFDNTAAVWEEQIATETRRGTGTQRGQSFWEKKAGLVDSRTSVTDVKFAPKHMNLQLATCSKDGTIRIYEAVDVTNLSHWTRMHEIKSKKNCCCLSWNPSRNHAAMIAVGSDDASPSEGGKVQIFEYNDGLRKWQKVETLNAITEPVHDVEFAPNLGRSYHLLAIACNDVKIASLEPNKQAGKDSNYPKFTVNMAAQFKEHGKVWRVRWNVTGTILASSGDDGCVRLWKANYLDNWKCIGVLKGNGSPAEVLGSSVPTGY